MNTSSDAIVRYRTSGGAEELALIEWKYTESYEGIYHPEKDRTRLNRYTDLIADPDSPIRPGVRDLTDLFVEPVYQLLRLQLLASQTEVRRPDLDAVRVVICASEKNAEYWRLPVDRVVACGVEIDPPPTGLRDFWSGMLNRPDRFVAVDTGRLVHPDAPTSDEFKDRYGHLASA